MWDFINAYFKAHGKKIPIWFFMIFLVGTALYFALKPYLSKFTDETIVTQEIVDQKIAIAIEPLQKENSRLKTAIKEYNRLAIDREKEIETKIKKYVIAVANGVEYRVALQLSDLDNQINAEMVQEPKAIYYDTAYLFVEAEQMVTDTLPFVHYDTVFATAHRSKEKEKNKWKINLFNK